MLSRLLFIGLGGFTGSVARYLVGGLVQEASRSVNFPYGTLAVNALGCLVIGFASQLLESRGFFSESARFFVFVGLLGGFTTFSTFSNESMNLLQRNQMLLGAVNVVLQVSLGLFAVWIGRTFAYLLWR